MRRRIAQALRYVARWCERGAEKVLPGIFLFDVDKLNDEDRQMIMDSPDGKWFAIDSAGNVIPPSTAKTGEDATTRHRD